MISIDTILTVLAYGVALSGLLPLSPSLEKIPLVLTAAAFCYGLYADRKSAWLSGRIATGLSIIAVVWYMLQVNRQNLAAPMVNMAVLLLSVRFVTAKSHRNYLQILALALFCLAASSLYGLSPNFILYLVTQLLLSTFALVFLTFYQRNPGYRFMKKDLLKLLRTASAIPLLTVPLIVLFFFILPRTQFPLWDLLARGGAERAGVSDTLEPGDKSSISTGGEVAFRASMERLPQNNLYWRCMVLNSYDGRSWKRVEPPTENMEVTESVLTGQTIFLEPGQTSFYPGLDTPVKLSGVRASRTVDYLFKPNYRGGTRLKYQVQSRAGLPANLRPKAKIDRRFYTAVPDTIPARLASLGMSLEKRYRSDRERLDGAERIFLDAHLNYGTSGLPTGSGAMENFLFKSKKGHCELFASTFALILRLAGVPARLVGGYLGGEYSEVGGYYLVTSSRAHVWVEAWIEGSGWVRVDPSRFTETFGEFTELSGRSLQSRFAVYLDAFNYYWNSVVINYDLEKQISIVTNAGSNLKQVSLPKPKIRHLLPFMGGVIAIAGLVLLARRKKLTAEERILQRLRRLLLDRFGVEITPGMGLHGVVTPLGNPELDRFVEIYSAAIYRDCTLSDEELRELQNILQALEGKGNISG